MMIVALIPAGHDDEDDGDLDGLGAPKVPEDPPLLCSTGVARGPGGILTSPCRHSGNPKVYCS